MLGDVLLEDVVLDRAADLVEGHPLFFGDRQVHGEDHRRGALIVIEVVTLSSGIPSNRISMSFSESTATPHIPTSPLARESRSRIP